MWQIDGCRILQKRVQSSTLPFVDLVLDCTTVVKFHPRGLFRDAAPYAEVQKRAYIVKSQVAVIASSPHYASFLSPEIPAATHDREILKKKYDDISFYLGKTNS
jgi:hypothetical protein